MTGKYFESDAREALEKERNTPSSACGFSAHPSDNKYEGNPDCLGPANLVLISKRRMKGVQCYDI